MSVDIMYDGDSAFVEFSDTFVFSLDWFISPHDAIDAGRISISKTAVELEGEVSEPRIQTRSPPV